MINPVHNHKPSLQALGISVGIVTAVALAAIFLHNYQTAGVWVTHKALVPMSVLGGVGGLSLLTLLVTSCVKSRKPLNETLTESVGVAGQDRVSEADTEKSSETDSERETAADSSDTEEDETETTPSMTPPSLASSRSLSSGTEEAGTSESAVSLPLPIRPDRVNAIPGSTTITRREILPPNAVLRPHRGNSIPVPTTSRDELGPPSNAVLKPDRVNTVPSPITMTRREITPPIEMLKPLVGAFEGMIHAGLLRWGKDKKTNPESRLMALKASMEALRPMISKLLNRPELLVKGLKPTQLLRRWITAVNCSDSTHMRYQQLAANLPIDKIEIDHPRLLKQIISILGRKLYLFHKLMQPTKDTTELFREFYMEFLESESIDVLGVEETQKTLWYHQIKLREKKIEVAFVRTKDRAHPIVSYALNVYKKKRGKDANLESLQKHLPEAYRSEYMVIPCTVSEHPMETLKTWGGTLRTGAWFASFVVDIAGVAKPKLAELVPQGFVDVGIAQKGDPELKVMGGNLAEALTDIIVDGYLLSGKFNTTFGAVVREDFPILHEQIQELVGKDKSVDELLTGFQAIIDELVEKLNSK